MIYYYVLHSQVTISETSRINTLIPIPFFYNTDWFKEVYFFSWKSFLLFIVLKTITLKYCRLTHDDVNRSASRRFDCILHGFFRRQDRLVTNHPIKDEDLLFLLTGLCMATKLIRANGSANCSRVGKPFAVLSWRDI